MGFNNRWAHFGGRMYERHAAEAEEDLQFHQQQEKIRLQYNRRYRQLRELEHQLGYLQRVQRHGQAEEQTALRNKIDAIQSELNVLHLKMRYGSNHNEDADFRRYYRHIRFTRPFVLIFNLILWSLLFWFGGVATGLKIVILIFALMTTFGSLFGMIFLKEISERILKPIDSLKKGIYEISEGNYDITVNEGAANEIGPLIRAFNEMAGKLRESERLKTEYEENRKALIANISHDLKTPITSVQGYIEVITSYREIPPEKLLKYLKIIYSNTTYMNRLIDDLFLFSKLDMQKLDFHFEEIKIRPFIEDMMEEFRLDLEEKAIDFEYKDLLPDDDAVKLDAKRFYQIIRNIIDNAVKHGQGTQLKITTRLYKSDGLIHIDLADNGPGIPCESLEHIFERFYRVDSERTKDISSTGLGLAIAMELAQAHGGEISAVSNPGEGSCFTVSIPFVKENC
jgi:signal transduction histidine kinase